MPARMAMDLLMRAAVRRVIAAEPPCCEPESLAAETGVDPELARTLLPSTEAVLKAIAESALRRQLDHITRKLGAVSSETPAEQLIALGRAFVGWAAENKDDFRLLNSPLLNRVIAEDEIRCYHQALQQLTISMLGRARDQGQLRNDIDPMLLSLVARAFTYGLARLCVDDQLGFWLPNQDDLDENARLNTALETMADILLVGWNPDQPIRSEA